jgi:hypothetical protein
MLLILLVPQFVAFLYGMRVRTSRPVLGWALIGDLIGAAAGMLLPFAAPLVGTDPGNQVGLASTFFGWPAGTLLGTIGGCLFGLAIRRKRER